ncbi:MAG: hypothetical protein B7Y25_04055 [Alphaproteobacteria bacterium 16-39-46]|nr:MAG: hypothetical protein B7Y25_04055 [Alphaproteobacteria bacterium 16-39-46]OZA43872.1 MAG: hypothetical protein B7X84_02070 [Alphaproteobacteria bacterium 17-39-52]HQS84656.1 undecaprenyl-diphosphate phosphatase [Alphaproteobacteria bacterium]HQS94486.1 undecaprenyl-diphosphate phosphatase [Alphaproteobacteria bacterium]
MPFYAILILALIQGLTEFLPISSQAHLILVPSLLGWEEHGRFLDVAIHLGTLLAVLIYFYKDLWKLLMKGFFPLFKGKITSEGMLIFYLIIATLPALVAGYIIHTLFGDGLRNITIIAWTSIVFGTLLYGVDRFCPFSKTLKDMRWWEALFIGCAQIFSFLPGASRSGTTITGGRFLGLSRIDATRFSFLMSIPVVTGALVLTASDAFKHHGTEPFTQTLFWGVIISFGAGLFAISFLMRWLKHHSYAPFMGYRILLGVGLLLWEALLK